VTGFLAESRALFWLMASGAAIGMGSTQAVSRSFMAQISPPEREAEFFGFYVLSGKFASIFGPLLFGLISSSSGSQRLAVLSLLPLFVVGLVLILLVDPEKARRMARSPAPEQQ
jgi:UMF1 family MFS transporter